MTYVHVCCGVVTRTCTLTLQPSLLNDSGENLSHVYIHWFQCQSGEPALLIVPKRTRTFMYTSCMRHIHVYTTEHKYSMHSIILASSVAMYSPLISMDVRVNLAIYLSGGSLIPSTDTHIHTLPPVCGWRKISLSFTPLLPIVWISVDDIVTVTSPIHSCMATYTHLLILAGVSVDAIVTVTSMDTLTGGRQCVYGHVKWTRDVTVTLSSVKTQTWDR